MREREGEGERERESHIDLTQPTKLILFAQTDRTQCPCSKMKGALECI